MGANGLLGAWMTTEWITEHPLWQQGWAQFQRQEYFAAHESWEDLWRQRLPSDVKQGLQGLIQLAVACVHVQRRNYKGARGVLHRAQHNLAQGTLPEPLQAVLLPVIAIWAEWLTEPVVGGPPAWPQLPSE